MSNPGEVVVTLYHLKKLQLTKSEKNIKLPAPSSKVYSAGATYRVCEFVVGAHDKALCLHCLGGIPRGDIANHVVRLHRSSNDKNNKICGTCNTAMGTSTCTRESHAAGKSHQSILKRRSGAVCYSCLVPDNGTHTCPMVPFDQLVQICHGQVTYKPGYKAPTPTKESDQSDEEEDEPTKENKIGHVAAKTLLGLNGRKEGGTSILVISPSICLPDLQRLGVPQRYTRDSIGTECHICKNIARMTHSGLAIPTETRVVALPLTDFEPPKVEEPKAYPMFVLMSEFQEFQQENPHICTAYKQVMTIDGQLCIAHKEAHLGMPMNSTNVSILEAGEFVNTAKSSPDSEGEDDFYDSSDNNMSSLLQEQELGDELSRVHHTNLAASLVDMEGEEQQDDHSRSVTPETETVEYYINNDGKYLGAVSDRTSTAYLEASKFSEQQRENWLSKPSDFTSKE